MQHSDVSIAMKGVSCRYQANTVVEDLSLEVGRGEFFTLLGPSGCGKTTTLRAIAGFEFPVSGSIHISGKDYTYAPPNARPVNYVFQNYALFPHMSVLKNVSYGLRRRGIGRREATERSLEELARVRLDQHADRLPNELSGGQQQRVALARALVNRPDVLLLDEPLSAIDSQLRLQLRSELTRLQRETGITFVFVTHDQVEALSMSDRIALMSDGKIIQLASPAEIYRRPSSVEAARFIGNSAVIDGSLRRRVDGIWEFHTQHGEAIPVSDTVVQRTAKTPEQVAHLTLKPEDVTLRPVAHRAEKGVHGTVLSTQYQGSDVAIEVELLGGRRIVVTEDRPAGVSWRPRYERGETVAVSVVDDEQLTLL